MIQKNETKVSLLIEKRRKSRVCISRKYSYITIFLLTTISFFLPLSESMNKLLVYLIYSYLILKAVHSNWQQHKISGNRRWVFKLFTFIIILSIFPAKLYWGQSFSASIISILPFCLYYIYIILYYLNIPKEFLRDMIVKIGKVAIILTIIKWIIPSIPIGSVVEDSIRGSRVLIGGTFFIYFTYFYYLYNIIKTRDNYDKKKLYWLGLAIIAILIPMTRQRIIMAFGMGLLMAYIYLKGNKRIILIGCVCVVSVLLMRTASFMQMVKATDSQINSSSTHDRIRDLGYFYYFEVFPKKGINMLIGNGVPSYGRSSYGKEAEEFAESTDIHLIDIGIVGIYHYFGWLGVTAYIFIIFYFISKKDDEEYRYCKFMLGFIFGCSFLSGVPLIPNQYMFIGICAYLLTPIKDGRKYNYYQLQYSSIGN